MLNNDIWMWALALVTFTFLFFYPFVFYPMLLSLLVRRQRTPRVAPSQPAPTVALVICALNEEKVIRQKIENSLALEYPEGKLRIVIVNDGSTDSTAAIAREYVSRGIELIDQPVRRGKIANLNQVLTSRTEDILALSDANVFYRADAVARLVERFADPTVGCVSGRVILSDSDPLLDGPTTDYYSVEWLLQKKASDLYSMVGADGAMYAMRRELFQPCPGDTIIEDFMIPMAIVRQGKRVVFESEAVGWEQGPASLGEEFRRKVRIAAGAMQGLLRGNAWPGRAPLKFWFIFVSHKLLRWLSPALGLATLAVLLLSLDHTLSQLAVASIAALNLLALLRLVTGWRHPLLSAPFYFLFGQIAIAVGLVKGMTGRQTVLWAKANR